MKKLICILVALFVFAGQASFAQDKKAPEKKALKAEKASDKKKADAAAPAADKKATKVKKDGTPDMRYKENKEAVKAKPAGPMKKDGTPDMRHKANKDAAAKAKEEKKK